MTPSYVDPWTTPQHDDWVSGGQCPSIHNTKAWCNDMAGHGGLHWAPYIQPDGRVQYRRSWSADEEHPRRQP